VEWSGGGKDKKRGKGREYEVVNKRVSKRISIRLSKRVWKG
jgi:hypothetical protein